MYSYAFRITSYFWQTQTIVFFLNGCCVLLFYVFVCCYVCWFCTGHFVMVPLNLTYLHYLQHFFFEHLVNLYHNQYKTFYNPCWSVNPSIFLIKLIFSNRIFLQGHFNIFRMNQISITPWPMVYLHNTTTITKDPDSSRNFLETCHCYSEITLKKKCYYLTLHAGILGNISRTMRVCWPLHVQVTWMRA